MFNAIQLRRASPPAIEKGVPAGKLAIRDAADDLVIHRSNGAIVQVRSKMLTVGKKQMQIDPYQLIRMIKQVTQTIGEYKDSENPYAQYVVHAMRKARSDMVSDLEHHFNINWQIDEKSGKSVFFI